MRGGDFSTAEFSALAHIHLYGFVGDQLAAQRRGLGLTVRVAALVHSDANQAGATLTAAGAAALGISTSPAFSGGFTSNGAALDIQAALKGTWSMPQIED